MTSARNNWKKLYPFQSHFLDLEGVRYHYLDEGEGEPVVMVHGNPTWSFYYRTLVDDLRRDYRVIVPDHVGCGLSDKPQRYDYTLARHIANLETLLERLALKNITLALHDWGGPIGMGYAVRHPERIKRLIIFNTVAFWSDQIPWFLRLCRLPVVGEIVVRGLNLFALVAAAVACRRRERMTREVKAGYLAPYDSYANRVAILRFVRDIPVDARHPTFAVLQSIEQRLGLFQRHPVIIMWGGQDPVFTKSLLGLWRERFPGAIIKEIEDAGHYVVEDAHERIIPWLREFLEQPAAP